MYTVYLYTTADDIPDIRDIVAGTLEELLDQLRKLDWSGLNDWEHPCASVYKDGQFIWHGKL